MYDMKAKILDYLPLYLAGTHLDKHTDNVSFKRLTKSNLYEKAVYGRGPLCTVGFTGFILGAAYECFFLIYITV